MSEGKCDAKAVLEWFLSREGEVTLIEGPVTVTVTTDQLLASRLVDMLFQACKVKPCIDKIEIRIGEPDKS